VNSGGVDLLARLRPILARGRGHIVSAADASPWLVASDVLITDHSSIGFEYLLLDRPLIRIEVRELISGADIAPEYVELMVSAARTVTSGAGIVPAVEEALAAPRQLSAARKAIAAELFHEPGGATGRAAAELYALMELNAPVLAATMESGAAAALP